MHGLLNGPARLSIREVKERQKQPEMARRLEERPSLATSILTASTALLLLGVVVGVGTWSAYSSTTPNSGNTFTASSCFYPTQVSITSFQFTPATITISQGCSVIWTNNASVKHTTTSNTCLWDSGNLNPGQTFTRQFNSAGSFPYKCKIHQTQMQGTVVVN